VALAEKFDFIVVSFAYSELTSSPTCPPSISGSRSGRRRHRVPLLLELQHGRLASWYDVGNREVISNGEDQGQHGLSQFLAISARAQTSWTAALISPKRNASATRRAGPVHRRIREAGLKLRRRRRDVHLGPRAEALRGRDGVYEEFFDHRRHRVARLLSGRIKDVRISMVIDEQKIERLLKKVKESGFKFD
jgi:hypothetical protein